MMEIGNIGYLDLISIKWLDILQEIPRYLSEFELRYSNSSLFEKILTIGLSNLFLFLFAWLMINKLGNLFSKSILEKVSLFSSNTDADTNHYSQYQYPLLLRGELLSIFLPHDYSQEAAGDWYEIHEYLHSECQDRLSYISRRIIEDTLFMNLISEGIKEHIIRFLSIVPIRKLSFLDIKQGVSDVKEDLKKRNILFESTLLVLFRKDALPQQTSTSKRTSYSNSVAVDLNFFHKDTNNTVILIAFLAPVTMIYLLVEFLYNRGNSIS